jgi:glucosylceramidase
MRFEAFAVPAWQSSESKREADVTIDAAQQFQSILGFGAAFTDASCYLLDRMAPELRAALLREFFSSEGLDLSVCRTCIGSSDYSRSVYTFDDAQEPDPELKHFSIEHDRAYILPTLRAALAVNPNLFLFSSPWSPPAWMKSNRSLLGGSMRKQYFAAYAQYFVRFLAEYRAAGVPIQAVTSQNEVDSDQDGRMPAALWGQEYEIEFVAKHLGPALRSASPETRIWLLDHNYTLWGRVLDCLSDPELAPYIDGVAWHGYAGSPEAMSRVHQAYPEKHAYWTEGGPFYTAPDYATDWAEWSAKFAVILKNWARTIVGWNLVLDEQGKPNIGPFDCGGVVTLDTPTQTIQRSGQYWAFAHYSKAVRRGARVIATRSPLDTIEHVAFANPDGDYVLVLVNRGDKRDIECRFGSRVMFLDLPAGAVVTLQWRN